MDNVLKVVMSKDEVEVGWAAANQKTCAFLSVAAKIPMVRPRAPGPATSDCRIICRYSVFESQDITTYPCDTSTGCCTSLVSASPMRRMLLYEGLR